MRSAKPLLTLALLALSACAQGPSPSADSSDVTTDSPIVLGLSSKTRDPIARAPGAIDSRPTGSVATFYGGSSLAPPGPAVQLGSDGAVTIDLEDADIATAAKAVLGDVMKAAYTIDPKVQGKITVKTGKALPSDQALNLFESALADNGVALIKSANAYRIVPMAAAVAASPTGVTTAGDNSDGPGFALRAVVLKHISAAEMADILKPIAKDVVARVDKERNALVLQGGNAQFDAAMETIHTFDVDWLANKSVGVFRLSNASAENVSKALTTLLQNDNIDVTMAKFITLEGSDTVIAVAKTPEILSSIRRWVARLDRLSSSPLRMFTYEMRYARAAAAGPIVGSALGVNAVVAGGTGAASKAPEAGRTGAEMKPSSSNSGAQSAGATGTGSSS